MAEVPPLRQRVAVWQGDITKLVADAIVNAANPNLLPGGGVAGAIHRAAGPRLAAKCATLGGCRTGEAKITPGYNLPAKHVIHTVGPVWHGGGNREAEQLASCYRASLALAEQHGAKTLAFPAISTGIYGFPATRAARIAAREVRAFLVQHPTPERVVFVAYGAESYTTLSRAVDEVFGTDAQS